MEIAVILIIAIVFLHARSENNRIYNKSKHIVDEAIIEYPELEDMIEFDPSFYDKLINDIDTLLPCAIDIIIERRLSN